VGVSSHIYRNDGFEVAVDSTFNCHSIKSNVHFLRLDYYLNFVMSGAFIVGAKRTPFGAFGGAFKAVSATQLGVTATQAALTDGVNKIDPQLVDHVFFGNVIPSAPEAPYLARHVGLKAGCPIGTPALTLNRLCGSGLETVRQAVQTLQYDKSLKNGVIVAGGVEHMSGAPLATYTGRWGTQLGRDMQLLDTLWNGLQDAHVPAAMGQTAENVATDFGISREQSDAYALQSQQRWQQAHEQGVFDAELVPVAYKDAKKRDQVLTVDEHPRPSTTAEGLAKLSPVFGGVVTAGNASGICDGAGALVVASEAAIQQHNWKPLCRVVATAVTGCDPSRMGLGPVTAIPAALQQTDGLTLDDMDLIEINEAFAPQVLGCAQALDIDISKLNIHGGAIALGHPLAASGSRLLAHLSHQLGANNDSMRYAVGAACIGGGQGIAVVLEKC
jgi:acetyl-CoA acyltransferase 2